MVTSLLSLFCFFNHCLPNQDHAAQLYPKSVAQETPPVCHRSYFLAGLDRFIRSPVDEHLGSHNVFFNTLDSCSLPHYIRESEIPNPMRIPFPSVIKENYSNWSHGPQTCLTQWNYEPCCVGPPKTDRSWWRVLTKRGPLEKGVANHIRILALRTTGTVWKGKIYDTER